MDQDIGSFLDSSQLSIVDNIHNENLNLLLTRWVLSQHSPEKAVEIFGGQLAFWRTLARIPQHKIHDLASTPTPLGVLTHRLDQKALELAISSDRTEIQRFFSILPLAPRSALAGAR